MQELGLQANVHYRVMRALSGPRLLTLAIFINPRYARKITSMGDELSMAAGLHKDAFIRIERGHRGTLTLEIPKPQNLWSTLHVSRLPKRHGLRAVCGIDGEHRPTDIDFANPLSPHVLICGTTGAGKSNAQRLLVYDLASQNHPGEVGFVLIDCQKRGKWWKDFANLPHLLHPIVTEETEAHKVLMWAVAELDRRAIRDQTKPSVFIWTDEVQSILSNEEIGRLFQTLAEVGREYGLHCGMALQNPTAELMGGTANLKRNMVTRLVGKVDSPTTAHVATGQNGSGAERLTGFGDFLLIDPMIGTKRVTVAHLQQRDIEILPYSETIRTLDLLQYEDTDHVLEQADVGRPQDPLKMKHLALALKEPDVSQRELHRQFSIGFTKAKRVLESAVELREELRLLGCRVVCGGATKWCNETK